MRQCLEEADSGDPSIKCEKMPSGWYCTRFGGHLGPCAARTKWWRKAFPLGTKSQLAYNWRASKNFKRFPTPLSFVRFAYTCIESFTTK
jgi:hypothetical protein